MIAYLQMIETQEDRANFVLLYTECKDWIGTIAFSILHNTHDAEAVVHNAFVKIAENIKKIDGPFLHFNYI